MPDDARDTRIVLTVLEAARALGVGRNQAYAAVRRGDLPALRVGRRLLIPRAALERLVDPGAGSSPPQRVGGEAPNVCS